MLQWAIIVVTLWITETQGAAIDTSKCGISKGCLGLPSDCLATGTCQAITTWEDDGDKIKFEMSNKPSGPDGYVSFGIITMAGPFKMSPASVLDCIRSNGNIAVGYSSNVGPSNILVSGTEGITVISTEYEGGELRCFFTRDKAVNKSGIPPLADQKYTVNLAFGNLNNGAKLQHSDQGKAYSTSEVSLTQTSTVAGGSSNMKLVKAHGTLMIIAWIVLAGSAVTLARYYKDMWPGTIVPVYKKPIWFSFHVICNVLVLFCTVAAFIIIYAYRRDWSYLRGESPKILKSHPYLGVVVTFCAILNPLMALCRPDPGAPRREIFNWAHWFVGTVGLVLGVLMCFAGLNLSTSRSVTAPWMTRLLLAFVIFHFFVDITLEILRCMANKKKKQEFEMHEPGSQPKDVKKPFASAIRTFLIILYVLFALATTLALVIGIGVL